MLLKLGLIIGLVCGLLPPTATQTFVVPKNKTAQVSSKYYETDNPNLGMDGNTIGTYATGVQCFHSGLDDPLPWWMVDLEQSYVINGVRVWNRVDHSAARFTQISIGVSSDPAAWTNFSTVLFDLCAYWAGVPTDIDSPIIGITCLRSLYGRYLAVYKNLTGLSEPFLHFCEIDVYFTSLPTFLVSKGKTAQLSTKYDPLDNPSLGMDGNTIGTYATGVQCFHSGLADPLPWWMVDLEQSYVINAVRLWNRVDNDAQRFTQISIGISSSPSAWANFSTDFFDLCEYWPGVATPTDSPLEFTCPRSLSGRYLAVYKNLTGLSEPYLHFCEIDIFCTLPQSDMPTKSYVGNSASPGFSVTPADPLFNASVSARSDVECVVLCCSKPSCRFALFGGDGPECWLFASSNIPQSFVNLVSSGGARFLEIMAEMLHAL